MFAYLWHAAQQRLIQDFHDAAGDLVLTIAGAVFIVLPASLYFHLKRKKSTAPVTSPED